MPPTNLTIEKTYAGVSRYSSNRMVLSPDGMRELRSRISFTQLRFHCRKQQHGRTFHVKTAASSSGETVVGFICQWYWRFSQRLWFIWKNSRETTQSLLVDAQNGGRKTARIMLENGDMKGIRSCRYTQHSLGITIIGSRGQAMTDGNVMTIGTIWRVATFGRFISVN